MQSLLAAAKSHVGAVREHNQDSYEEDPERGIFLVADGMGGHAAGEVASRLAVRVTTQGWATPSMRARIERYAERGDPESRRDLLEAVALAVLNAHNAIVTKAAADEAMRGMGTTLTGFLIAGGDAIFAHAGDSRAYLVRDGIPMLLSEDQSVSARIRAAGMRGQDVEEDPSRWEGVLTNALGVDGDARVSTFIVPLYSGDRFLLCSDGVHQYFTEAEIGEVMMASPSPARAAQRFVELALERGGADNATAVVVKVVEAGETRIPLEQQQRDDAVLAASDLLGKMTPQQRLRALRVMAPQEYGEGRPLPPVALDDRVAYLVLDGAVAYDDGALVRAGGLVYPEALTEPAGPAAREAAAETAVRVLVMRRNDYLELCNADEDLGARLFEAVGAMTGQDKQRLGRKTQFSIE